MFLLIPGSMQKNLPVLYKIAFFILLAALPLNHVQAEEASIVRWYRSNSSGMALEFLQSRLVALRNEYSLSVEYISSDYVHSLLPPSLLGYYQNNYTVEFRTLFLNGQEHRKQWIFRDRNNTVRLNASGRGEENFSVIELINQRGQVERELRFELDESEWELRFFYNGSDIVYVDSFYKENFESDSVHFSRDYYLYTRSGFLRGIERTVYEQEEIELSRLVFPRLDSSAFESYIHGIVYTTPFLQNISAASAVRINYFVDNRGRVTSEIWYDEEDQVVGEFSNTWSNERLMSVLWQSHSDERLVEYEYDNEGSRISERNYRNGLLERTVTFSGSREVEEIYMSGRLILRAIWEDGVRISEERIR